MTLVQLEYIVAVDTYRSFVAAAEKCFVTQPTLSMQVQKIEDLLGVKIFDRSTQPINPTEIGVQVIAQARTILQEAGKMNELISAQKLEVSGEFKIGVIPTVAPYLLPRVIANMLSKYPDLKLMIWEYTTQDILMHLRTGVLDCGILATPLAENNIIESVLYYENFVGYLNKGSKLYKKKIIDAADLNEENVWVLNEGHCMRNQVLNICRSTKNNRLQGLEYNTGSVETLVKMVDLNGGATLLPELGAEELTGKQKNRLRNFKAPEPAREISLVTSKNFIKNRMLELFKTEILETIPKHMKNKKRKDVVDV